MTLFLSGFAVILGSIWFANLTGDCTNAGVPLLLFWGLYRILAPPTAAEGGQG